MSSLGHGVSDAVRKHIPVWVTPEVSQSLGSSHSQLSNPKNWVRTARRNSPSGKGFEREYKCKTNGNLRLFVHSPEDDYSADSYVFFNGPKPVAGGKTSLKSVQLTSRVSTGDKTELKGSSPDPGYKPLTKDELDKMEVQMSYGEGSYVFLELERG